MTQEILSILQKNFPLNKRPFLEIAKQLNTDEKTIINIIKTQKEKNIIRQISPIFDTKRLGYRSSLVAFKIEQKDIKEAIKFINSHPGVSHNYERNHSFNIWFTIAIDSDSKLGLEKTIQILANKAKAKDFIILPTIKLFKIAVKLDTTGKEPTKEKLIKKKFKDITLSPLQKEIIKYSQEDIDITQEPFKKIIDQIGIDYELFFKELNTLKESGVMRRFAAILNHRKAGFSANAMVVWDIDEKDANHVGEIVAEFSQVSHCYLRPKYPNWQYNLFSMIHGKTKEQTDSLIDQIASEIEYKDKKALYSTREFKKVRLKYFTPEFSKWEEVYTPIS